MRAIITGSSGTIGTALRRALHDAGSETVAWDRRQVPIDDYDAMRGFVGDVRPDAIFHLAAASQPAQPESRGSWYVQTLPTAETGVSSPVKMAQ